MKVIYIASPYTKPDGLQLANVRRQIDVADALMADGFIPYAPLLSHFWNEIHQHDWDFWMTICKEMLLRCDAVLRLEGESKGADTEVWLALTNGIPVYHSLDLLKKHAKSALRIQMS